MQVAELPGGSLAAEPASNFVRFCPDCEDRRGINLKWIRDTLPKLTNRDALQRIAVIAAIEGDVANNLFVSGRCAVAHAFTNPVVDPDTPEHIIRLSADMPVAKALAEYLIEHELGVPWERST